MQNQVAAPTTHPGTEKLVVLLVGDIELPANQPSHTKFLRCTIEDAKKLSNNFIEQLSDAQAIIYRSNCPLTADVLSGAPELKVIVKAGSGLESVDRDYCRDRGIALANVAGANARSVAELALWQALGLARYGCLLGDDSSMHGIELAGKTAVVFGMGQIGNQLVALLRRLNLHVVPAHRGSNIANALRTADLLLVTASLNPSSINAIGLKELSGAKPGLSIVNIAPAEILNQSAVLSGLESERIAAVALSYPWKHSSAAQSRQIASLQSYGRILITPHLGANTIEARRRVSNAAWKRLQGLIVARIN
jgi:D-3-phosphoglycerate dehydrogenase / 2-oxoglutarate reductase